MNRRKRILSRANKRISLGNAAALLIFASMFGQVLGFLRTRLVNANFSALGPQSTDAYFAAFKIPDFFFFTVAAGALGVAFMPFIADRLERSDRKGAWELSNSLLNFLAILMFFVGIIILIFAEPLIHYVVAPNLTPEQLHNASTIMRLIAFNPLLFTISGILMSVQQTLGRFFFYAVAPLFYNASIIASIYIFKDNLGLIGLGVGAMLGAVLQFLVSLFGFIGIRYKYQMKINWGNANFRQILKQLPARSLDQGIDSVNSIVETNLARRLGEGKLSYYENAYTIHTAPTLLIGTAISTAAFPRLTERLSQNRVDLFRKDFLMVLRVLLWITLPVAVIAFFTRGYLARLIFAKDASQIALILGFFAGAILFRTIYSIVSRWFYAQKDVRTTLYVSIFAIILNVVLAYWLSRPWHYDVAGLAMAQSAVAMAEVVILVAVMGYRDRKLFNKEFRSAFWRIMSVTGFTIVAAYTMISLLPLDASDRGIITLGSKLLGITVVTFAVHFSMSWLFGLEEVRPIIVKFKKIVLATTRIQ